MLDAEEINRRIVAARTLRNLSQRDLDALGERDGLGRQELSRVERGELPLSRVRRETLTRLLDVPADWFTAEPFDDVLARDPSQLDRIEQTLTQMLELLAALEPLQYRLEHLDQDARQVWAELATSDAEALQRIAALEKTIQDRSQPGQQ